MKLLILEDEAPTARLLKSLLLSIDATIEVVKVIDSVKGAIDFLQTQPQIDLIFSDIHLSDGLSFDIFAVIQINTPVIFTTAYDKYAVKAFKLNSIDYLLKPIAKEDLKQALTKFKNRTETKAPALNINDIRNLLTKEFKTRFLVKAGNALISVKTTETNFFIAEDGIVILTSNKGKRYPVDFTLEQLEAALNPAQFMRINRKVLVNIDAVEKAEPHLNGRYKIACAYMNNDDCLVSRERVAELKQWLSA